jgi:hypothetical protein
VSCCLFPWRRRRGTQHHAVEDHSSLLPPFTTSFPPLPQPSRPVALLASAIILRLRHLVSVLRLHIPIYYAAPQPPSLLYLQPPRALLRPSTLSGPLLWLVRFLSPLLLLSWTPWLIIYELLSSRIRRRLVHLHTERSNTRLGLRPHARFGHSSGCRYSPPATRPKRES